MENELLLSMKKDLCSSIRIKPSLSLIQPTPIPLYTIESRESVMKDCNENSPTSTISSPGTATGKLSKLSNTIEPSKILHLKNPSTNLTEAFPFHHVFTSNETHDEIFQSIGLNILDNLVMGNNAILLVFGDSQTGKGSLLYGDEEYGLLVKLVISLFVYQQLHPEIEVKLQFSCLLVNGQNDLYDLFCVRGEEIDAVAAENESKMKPMKVEDKVKMMKMSQVSISSSSSGSSGCSADKINVSKVSLSIVNNERQFLSLLLLAEKNREIYEAAMLFENKPDLLKYDMLLSLSLEINHRNDDKLIHCQLNVLELNNLQRLTPFCLSSKNLQSINGPSSSQPDLIASLLKKAFSMDDCHLSLVATIDSEQDHLSSSLHTCRLVKDLSRQIFINSQPTSTARQDPRLQAAESTNTVPPPPQQQHRLMLDEASIASFVRSIAQANRIFEAKLLSLEKERISFLTSLRSHFLQNQALSVNGVEEKRSDLLHENALYKEKLASMKVSLELKSLQLLLLQKEAEIERLKYQISTQLSPLDTNGSTGVAHPNAVPASLVHEGHVRNSSVEAPAVAHMEETDPLIITSSPIQVRSSDLVINFDLISDDPIFSKRDAPLIDMDEDSDDERVESKMAHSMDVDGAPTSTQRTSDISRSVSVTRARTKNTSPAISPPNTPQPRGSTTKQSLAQRVKEVHSDKKETNENLKNDGEGLDDVEANSSIQGQLCQLVPNSALRCRVCGFSRPSKCVTCSEFFGITMGICENCYHGHFQKIIAPENIKHLQKHLDVTRRRMNLPPFDYGQLTAFRKQSDGTTKKKVTKQLFPPEQEGNRDNNKNVLPASQSSSVAKPVALELKSTTHGVLVRDVAVKRDAGNCNLQGSTLELREDSTDPVPMEGVGAFGYGSKKRKASDEEISVEEQEHLDGDFSLVVQTSEDEILPDKKKSKKEIHTTPPTNI